MQKAAYMPHIDGLRAIAIVLVVIFHAGLNWVPGGFVGVDVFFVLSGFLITGQISQQINNGKFSFSGFYLRRFRRLLPAYIVVALVTFVIACFILLPKDLVYHTKLMGLAFLSLGNFYLTNTTEGYFARQTDEVALLHTWSLSVEEQFYLVWPLLLIWMMRYLKGNVLLVLIALMYLLAVGFSQWHVMHYPTAAYYLLPARFFELLTGAALALVVQRLPTLGAVQAGLVAIAGLLPIVISALYLHSGMQFPGINALPVCIGTGLLIYSGYSKNIVADLLCSKPLVALGRISYSLYLWHWPVFVFIRYVTGDISAVHALAGTVVSIVLSIATLHLVENTFRFRWIFSFRKTVVYMYLIPLLVFVVMVIVISKGKGWPERFGAGAVAVEAMEKPSIMYSEKCDFSAYPDCEQVILLGDSHAGHFSPFIHEFTQQKASLKLDTRSQGFCPPLPGIYRASIDKNTAQTRYFYEDNDCFLMMNHFYETLDQQRYKYVVLAGYWSMMDMKQDFLINKEYTDLSVDTSHKVLRIAFYEAITKLVAHNMTPVIIKDNPAITELLLKCSLKKALGQAVDDNCTVSYGDIHKQQGYARQLFEDIARDFPQVRFIDVNQVMCKDDACITTLDGMPLYKDKHHLTDVAARMLGKQYIQQFGNPLLH